MTDHRKILATFSLNDTLKFRLTDAGRAHLGASTCLAKVEDDGTCKMQAWEFAHVFGPRIYMGLPSLIEGCRVEVLEDHYAALGRQAGHAPAPSPALAHINRVRSTRHERPLDPTEAGWTGDDVEREAARLGWAGSTSVSADPKDDRLREAMQRGLDSAGLRWSIQDDEFLVLSPRPADYPPLHFTTTPLLIWGPGVFVEIEVVTRVNLSDDGTELTLDVVASDVEPASGLLESGKWEESHARCVLARLTAGLGQRVKPSVPTMEHLTAGEWIMTSVEAVVTAGVLRATISLVAAC